METVIALLMHWLGAQPETIRFATKAALVPTWFLAIYTMIVLLAPLSFQFWRRYGWGSLMVFVALAAVADVLFFQADLHWLGWSNYFWVWLAVTILASPGTMAVWASPCLCCALRARLWNCSTP
ncbi:hypothetical protein G8770_00895 [Aestuariicella hydrocarbonica]|uniref:Uncharacterized protein n=1 Tax=Pseudomaricurvus hydrocarbonicus TaxID=1470433 RepID=A0A9E5MJJ4_9GAMM|nr:hypothetical protein [Aestuariicella hydrocarbonica]NHO64102.1 hypothetical protein [Aestuariicella hydrocarbonica]